MELLAAVLIAMLTAGLLAGTLTRRDRVIPRTAIVYVWFAQAIFCLLFTADWSYARGGGSPLQLISKGHLVLLPPFLLGAFLLVWVPAARHRGTGTTLTLASVQALLLIPALVWTEWKTDTSFLSTATVGALVLSVSSAIAGLPPLLCYAGRKPGKLRDIAYKDRARLVEYLEEARGRWRGARWLPPLTLLDAGKLHGRVGERPVAIDTVPSLWPPGYRLCARVGLRRPGPGWVLAPLDRPTPWNGNGAAGSATEPWALLAREGGELLGLHRAPGAEAHEDSEQELVAAIAHAAAQLEEGALRCEQAVVELVVVSPHGLSFGRSKEQALLDLADAVELFWAPRATKESPA